MTNTNGFQVHGSGLFVRGQRVSVKCRDDVSRPGIVACEERSYCGSFAIYMIEVEDYPVPYVHVSWYKVTAA